MQDLGKAAFLYVSKDELLILKSFPSRDREQIKAWFDRIQSELESEYNITTFVAIGDSFLDYEELPVVYKKMGRLRKYFLIEGYGSTVDSSYLENRSTADISIDETKIHKLILGREDKEAISYLEDLFVNNSNIKNVSVDHIYQMAFKITNILQNITEEFKLKEDGIVGSVTELIERLYEADDISAMKGIFIDKVRDMIDQLRVEDSQYTPVVKQIINEVTHHYREDMNLKTLAHKYHMNTSYLGQIFLKEVGCSFSQYLSNMKNSKARELILNTNRRINDIAQEVGYPDTSYFYRKFKQCYGVSPASLREMKKY